MSKKIDAAVTYFMNEIEPSLVDLAELELQYYFRWSLYVAEHNVNVSDVKSAYANHDGLRIAPNTFANKTSAGLRLVRKFKTFEAFDDAAEALNAVRFDAGKRQLSNIVSLADELAPATATRRKASGEVIEMTKPAAKLAEVVKVDTLPMTAERLMPMVVSLSPAELLKLAEMVAERVSATDAVKTASRKRGDALYGAA